jgi:hypothetical protein
MKKHDGKIRSRGGTVCLCCGLLLAAQFAAYSQTPAGDQVRRGKQAFYEAEFEQTLTLMQLALTDSNLARADKFDANLYRAFALIRQNSPADSVRSYLIRAVTVDPGRELDANLMPPDLYEPFMFARQSTMGGVCILTEPDSAIAICYDRRIGKSVSLNTPASFHNLVSGEYELLVHATGYRDFHQALLVKSGKIDSIAVRLARLSKPWYKTWWAMGGAGACAVLAWVVFHGDSTEPLQKESDLPIPPSRP